MDAQVGFNSPTWASLSVYSSISIMTWFGRIYLASIFKILFVRTSLSSLSSKCPLSCAAPLPTCKKCPYKDTYKCLQLAFSSWPGFWCTKQVWWPASASDKLLRNDCEQFPEHKSGRHRNTVSGVWMPSPEVSANPKWHLIWAIREIRRELSSRKMPWVLGLCEVHDLLTHPFRWSPTSWGVWAPLRRNILNRQQEGLTG